MDISSFDFSLAEAMSLVSQLDRLAETVALEPRIHEDRETTYRVSCVLRSGDGIFAEVAALERNAGVRAVLDRDSTARFAHAG